MSNKVDLYLGHAEECCLAAVRAEDNNRRVHWLKAAMRWVALGRTMSAMVTTTDSATTERHNAVESLPGDLHNRRFFSAHSGWPGSRSQ